MKTAGSIFCSRLGVGGTSRRRVQSLFIDNAQGYLEVVRSREGDEVGSREVWLDNTGEEEGGGAGETWGGRSG